MARFSIVGAGPGDPELLTLGAYKALQSADVILYDRLVSEEILELAPERAQRLYVGKKEGEQKRVQSEIFSLLSYFASGDLNVVRLKGGDPFVFGRGIEELELLEELGQSVKVYPGVCSAIAVPGSVGIPVTARGVARGFAVVTGHLAGEGAIDWSSYAKAETLVILMGIRKRAQIAKILISLGRSKSEAVAFIEKGGTDLERVVKSSLEEVASGNTSVNSPAVFVVGPVNDYYQESSTRRAYGQGIRP